MESVKRKLHLLLYLCIAALLFSCSSGKVLFLNDPYFDTFASYSDKLYELKKTFAFYRNGYRCEFKDPDESQDFYRDVNDALKNGEYDALVTHYLSYHALEIPDGLPVVLIGGPDELLFPSISQVLSSDMTALKKTGSELQSLWEEEGLIPLTVFWEKPESGDKERKMLENSWKEENRDILTDNWLALDINTANSEKKMEDFFKKYDFESSEYIVFAYCAPVYKEFFRTIPDHPDLKLIMAVPDNPVLPDGTYALISENYTAMISAAVKSLKEYLPGNKIKVENNFIKK